MTTKVDNIVTIPDIKIPGQEAHFNEQEWDIILDRYFSTLIPSSNNSPSSQSGASINDFFPLVQNVLISRQNSEGVPEAHRVKFIEDEPPEEIYSETITFELIKRDNGSFSKGPPGKGGVKELTPHFRAEIEHPDRPGERLVTMGKFYDNWIMFNIYAKSNSQARKRLIWFEQVMEGFRWYFKLFGFSQVLYDGTGAREKVKVGELKLTKYPTVFYVKTDDTFHISRQELRKLVINAEVSQG